MANAARLPAHLRHPSLPGGSVNTSSNSSSGSGASPALVARISEKKAELANLKELRDLSGQLAGQMQTLQERLSTLADGTEAVAMVLSNWHNVLQAINMASMKMPMPKDDGQAAENENGAADHPLPQTLVRISVHDTMPTASANNNR